MVGRMATREFLPGWELDSGAQVHRALGLRAQFSADRSGMFAFYVGAGIPKGYRPSLGEAMLAAEDAAGVKPSPKCEHRAVTWKASIGRTVCGYCGAVLVKDPMTGGYRDPPYLAAPTGDPPAYRLPDGQPLFADGSPVVVRVTLPVRDGTEWPTKAPEKPHAPTRFDTDALITKTAGLSGGMIATLDQYIAHTRQWKGNAAVPDGAMRVIPDPYSQPVAAFDRHHGTEKCPRCSLTSCMHERKR